RVAVREQSGQAPPPRHAVAAGVVNDEQVDAAPLRGLGGDAGAGSPADDGAPFRDLLPESGQNLFTVPSHGSVLPSGDPGRAPARWWVGLMGAAAPSGPGSGGPPRRRKPDR